MPVATTDTRIFPSMLVSNIFTLIVLSPFLLMLALWAKLGANISNLPLSLSALGFHLGLGAIFGLYAVFWLQLNMFQVRPVTARNLLDPLPSDREVPGSPGSCHLPLWQLAASDHRQEGPGGQEGVMEELLHLVFTWLLAEATAGTLISHSLHLIPCVCGTFLSL